MPNHNGKEYEKEYIYIHSYINDNPLLYSCLGNPKDRGAWPAIVHGVTKELGMTVAKEQSVCVHVCVCVCVCVWVTLLYKRNEYNIANQPYLRNHKSTIKLKEKKKRWLPPQEEQLLYFSSFDCPKIIDQKEAQLFSYWISQERNNLFEGHVLSLSSHKLFRKGLNFLSCDLWFSKSSKNKYAFINNIGNNDIFISGGTKESKSIQGLPW